jgi:hypothetical protein
MPIEGPLTGKTALVTVRRAAPTAHCMTSFAGRSEWHWMGDSQGVLGLKDSLEEAHGGRRLS